MRIPREFIRTLSERADIVEIVGERVQLKRRGANFFGLCPFHNEKTPSFSVNPSRNFYHCFGCGASGGALDFIVRTECAGDFVAGVESLAARLGMTVPREGGAVAAKAEDDLGELLKVALGHWRRNLAKTPRAQEYLKGRGMTGETAARFMLGFAPDEWRGLEKVLPDYNGAGPLRVGLVREREVEKSSGGGGGGGVGKTALRLLSGTGDVSDFHIPDAAGGFRRPGAGGRRAEVFELAGVAAV